MIHMRADQQAKGWFVGPWNSDVPIPVGYANAGIDLTHYHAQMYEIYLVAQGTSTIIVNGKELQLQQGDVYSVAYQINTFSRYLAAIKCQFDMLFSIIAVAPHEVHTFTTSSDDYFHFVVQTPFVKGDKVVVQSGVEISESSE